jgi:MFS family permease
MILPKEKKILYYLFGYGMIILSAFFLQILSSYFAGFAAKHLNLDSLIIGIIVFCLPIGRGIAFAIMARVNTNLKLNLSGIFAAFTVLGMYIISYSANIFLLIIVFIILGFFSGFGFSGGFSMIVDLSDKNRGLYTGIVESMVGISFFISPSVPFLVFGENAEYSPFWFAMIVYGVLALLFFALRLMILKRSVKTQIEIESKVNVEENSE